jgi:hypothetical protein
MPAQFVSCKLYGGLGNQLFQIFATIAYSLQHDINFIFEYSANLGKRRTYWDSLLSSISDHVISSVPPSTLVNQGTHGFVKLAAPKENITLNGYFQSFLFFEPHLKTILKMLDVEKNQNIKKKYINQKNSISLHFRRGDYKDLQDCHPIMEIDYYANALNYILLADENLDNKITVYYFCEEEDLESVEKDVATLKNEFRDKITFVRHLEETDWEEMLSMSCCKHNIIANSSFSWWGAYLNMDPEKIVCYPSVWFGPLICENTETMFPEKWIKI